MMLKHFAQTIEKIEGQIISWSAPYSLTHDLPGFLVAVSGGADSMCLADLCLKHLGKDRFAIAHCNFNLRGEESDGDEALVVSWASANGIRLYRNSFATDDYASSKGISIEMAARELRYRWFSEICRKHGFCGVMTAHNANDNAETLMLNLLRGSGLRGISGMTEISSNESLLIIRPLLDFTRKQIEGHVFAWKVPYREDSTNAQSDFKRNRIRNEVFPQFEKINPSFVRTLNREMKYFSEADQIVEEWCRCYAEKLCRCSSEEEGVSISIPGLLETPHWRYLLYHMLSPFSFHSSVLASVENLLISERTMSGKRFESDTHLLLVERDELRVSKKTDAPSVCNEVIMPVRGEGTYHFNGRSFTVEILPWTSDMPLKQPDGTVVFDASRLSFPFVLRRWNQGDWFIPFGFKGRKKISDLFADLKYDTSAKEASVMIVDCTGNLAEEKHVAGVAGVRIDDAYRITPSTKHVIRITCGR